MDTNAQRSRPWWVMTTRRPPNATCATTVEKSSRRSETGMRSGSVVTRGFVRNERSRVNTDVATNAPFSVRCVAATPEVVPDRTTMLTCLIVTCFSPVQQNRRSSRPDLHPDADLELDRAAPMLTLRAAAAGRTSVPIDSRFHVEAPHEGDVVDAPEIAFDVFSGEHVAASVTVRDGAEPCITVRMRDHALTRLTASGIREHLVLSSDVERVAEFLAWGFLLTRRFGESRISASTV
jgi:hypothetical protein